ncbi:hypothetical protein M1403_02260 [Patescibacteria group bacterium]|nr:hypothetical protein [Patescibacteria group bacterium]
MTEANESTIKKIVFTDKDGIERQLQVVEIPTPSNLVEKSRRRLKRRRAARLSTNVYSD